MGKGSVIELCEEEGGKTHNYQQYLRWPSPKTKKSAHLQAHICEDSDLV